LTLETQEAGPMSKLLPDTPDKPIKCTVYLPASMWDRLEEISEETKEGGKAGHDRQEVVRRFLAWAISEYEAERKRGRK
jgi:hypothetical protein